MKTRTIISATFIALAILVHSCEEYSPRIVGEGSISTETLDLSEFTGIRLQGIDNVHIAFGPDQHVEVTGHPNIIARIQKEVVNSTWYIELEDGNYGKYELTYYITLPSLEYVFNIGAGDVIIEDAVAQEHLEVILEGTGSFEGFSIETKHATVDITGTGHCEVTATESLDAILEGTGSLYYKGYPVINANVTGVGKVVDANQ